MIPFQRPSLPSTAEIAHYLDLSREERWFSNGGPCWRLLRDRLGERVGSYCVPVASGTHGLMVTLAAVTGSAARTGARNRALMPSFTFVATAQAARWAGLTPELADIDPGHWHLDPALLEERLSEEDDIGAVLAVSAFGTPPPTETRTRWEAACGQAGVPLVVDSAAGFGAVADDGVPIGAQGDVEVVSFHATKPFAIGEGGAIFTSSRKLLERIELAVNFGLRPDRSVGFDRGLNAKMSELHAATGLAVLDHLDEIVAGRRRAAATIRERSRLGGWQEGCEHSTWQFVPVALADPEQRERVIAGCERAGIETRIYYEPLSKLLSAQASVGSSPLARTNDLSERILCLPMANDLSREDCEAIGEVLA